MGRREREGGLVISGGKQATMLPACCLTAAPSYSLEQNMLRDPIPPVDGVEDFVQHGLALWQGGALDVGHLRQPGREAALRGGGCSVHRHSSAH